MTKLVLGAILLAATLNAVAAEGDAPFDRQGWYVTPMATYMVPDSARCSVDGGLGGALAFGNRGEIASLELWGQYLSLSHGACTYTVPAPTATDPTARATVTDPEGDVKLDGGGLDLLLGPYGEVPVLRNVFGLVGFGAIRRQGHPQFPTNATTIFGDAGVGYFYPFRLFGLDVAARGEARYRYDVQQPPYPDDEDPPPAHAFQDWILNLGLQIALSPPPPPPPPPPQPKPEPVAVVPPAETDADHDGVPDDKDQCPATPAGAMVDETGCAPAPTTVTIAQAKAGDTVVLEGVTFETASARLTVNAQTILNDVARQLGARPELRVEIGGHTDDRGSDAYNQTLSERRAQSVMEYLVAQGVDAARLSAKGYGESRPLLPNDSDENREHNRRVELKVLGSDAARAGNPTDDAAPPPAQ